MIHPNIQIMEKFNLENIPDLDTTVLGALELFEKEGVPNLEKDPFDLPIITGSGNALTTAKIIYEDRLALFKSESSCHRALDTNPAIDGAIIISASGGKSSLANAKLFKEKGIRTILLTTNSEAPAKKYLTKTDILVFPKNREPYAYNVSTYLGMILAKTRENPTMIKKEIEGRTGEAIREFGVELGKFDSFFLIIPPELELVNEMFVTKFGELFGPRINIRTGTPESAKHAQTIVGSKTELFVTFGDAETPLGVEGQTLSIPFSQDTGYAAMLALGYYFIGQVQKANPQYFKENIADYTEKASKMFGDQISPIVE